MDGDVDRRRSAVRGGGTVRVAAADRWAEEAAGTVAAAVREAVADRGGCALALAGGDTPRPAYRRLAGLAGVPWSRVEVFFGDERAVPPDHPESNYRMAREELLDRVAPLEPGQVHRIEAERDDLDRAAREYGARVPGALDVLLLGIGPDGHTASLFPGSSALGERERRYVAVEDGPDPVPRRVTATPPVLEAARRVVVLATGEEKAAAVRRALEGNGGGAAVCPARLARRGTWLLDPGAAARLGDAGGRSGTPAPGDAERGGGSTRT